MNKNNKMHNASGFLATTESQTINKLKKKSFISTLCITGLWALAPSTAHALTANVVEKGCQFDNVVGVTLDQSDPDLSNNEDTTGNSGDTCIAPVATPDAQHNPGVVSDTNPTTVALVGTNDTDADGTIDPATVDLDPSTPGIQSTLTNGDGTYVADTSGNVTFTPDATLTGDPTPIPYTINDNHGNTSNEALLSVTYGDAPVATPDAQHNSGIVSPANPTTLSAVDTNDTDADGTIDPATVDLDPSTAGIQSTLTNADGTYVADASGNVTFTPDAALVGDPTPIPYTINDNDGNTSNEALLTVTYGDAPVAVDDAQHNPGAVSPTNPTTLSAVDTNDTDADGTIDPATVDLDPSTAGIQSTLTNADGTYVADASGNVTFTPDAALVGDPTPIPYTINDNDGNTSNTALLTVTYGDAPVATPDAQHNPNVVSPSNPTTIATVDTNDTDADGTIDPATVDLDPSTAGIQSTLTNADGTYVADASGNVTFTPDAALVGDPTPIPYTINDNDGNTSNEALLTVTYGDAPVAVDDAQHNPGAVSPANPTTLSAVDTNDTDADGTIDPATVDLDPSTAGIQSTLTNADGTYVADASGNVTFTPDAALVGDPTPIPYTINDNDGNTSNTALLTVTYGDAPVATPDAQHNPNVVSPSNPTTIATVDTNDTDADGTIDPATVDLDPSTAGIQSTLTNADGTYVADASGNVTFTPDAALVGDPTPIPYTINDNDGNTSNTALLTVTYGDAPVATPDAQHNPNVVSPSNPTTIATVDTNDTDADGTIDPATVDLDPSTAGIQSTLTNADGTYVADASGNVTFTPDAALVGDPTPIPYTINDNDGNTSNEALLTVTYGDAPVAVDDAQHNPGAVSPANPTTLSAVDTNDTDADGTIDPATVDLDPSTAGIQSTLTNADGTYVADASGNVTFTPDAALVGDPTPIPYTINDNDGNTSNEALLTVTYGDAPTAVDDAQHNPGVISPSNPTTLATVDANDTDPDGTIDPATVDLDPSTAGIQSSFTTANGTYVADALGNVTFTPSASLTIDPTPIPYTINDNDGNTSNEALLTVTYGEAPTAVDDEQHNIGIPSPTNPTTIATVDANDSDPDGTIDPATVDLDPSTDGIQSTLTNIDGTYAVDATGNVTFTPDASLTGNPSPIPYTINDNDGNTSNVANLTVTYSLSADVFVTKTLVTPAPYTSGQTITYEIVVGNSVSSAGTATNIVVTDMPTNMTITNVSSTNCSALPCTIPSLAIGVSETITVQALLP